MTGSIEKRGKDSYRLIVSCGTKDKKTDQKAAHHSRHRQNGHGKEEGCGKTTGRVHHRDRAGLGHRWQEDNLQGVRGALAEGLCRNQPGAHDVKPI